MKTTILCFVLILSIACHRGHTTSTNQDEVIHAEHNLLQEETSVQETRLRSKRHSPLSICRFCCNCCKNKGCGLCCLT
ncbi:hepcidin isoform X1 [Rana temporaria]|uniref:hepcidin isoform X1 n=1 Tax=Rana temporaria TaxID=8407 RepID=UPI001AAD2A4C|nr:hepcidin isoform X1 [Rana temporaria]